MYQNYIFDLYGTLADIHTDEEQPLLWEKLAYFMAMQGAHYTPAELHTRYQDLIREEEAQTQAVIFSSTAPDGVAEIDISVIFHKLFEQKGISASEQLVARTAMFFRSVSLEKLRLFEGVTELLQKLRYAGKQVYLLSNAQKLFTRPELISLKLTPYFNGILLSSEAGHKKPDPYFYEMLLTQYKLDPARSVMIGNDDIADCHGAAAVGLDSMYICTEQSPVRTRSLPEHCIELSNISDVFLI